MPKIEKMLQMMQERGVERALLQSDKAFQITSGGKTVEGSVTPKAQLRELLEEITPPAFLPSLQNGGSFHFCHQSPFGSFDLGVDNFLGELKVAISPARQTASQLMTPPSLLPQQIVKRELFVHKNGQNIGPLSPEQARDELQNGRFAPHDMAITPQHPTWDSLQNVLGFFGIAHAAPTYSSANSSNPSTGVPTVGSSTNLVRSFLNEEQDPAAVARVVERLRSLCTPDETILYIAVQKKPVVTVAPVSIALTSKRIIIFRPKAMGMGLNFEDFLWRTVVDIHISEALLGATFTIRLTNKPPASVDSLPKAQARKIYQFGQQMEEHMHSHRRDLMLEEKRAAAGGVNVSVNATSAPPNSPQSSPTLSDDPIEKLQKLKTMCDMGLISQSEYETKKAEIMARF